MGRILGPTPLAPVGSTSNNSHAATSVDPSSDTIAVEFVVEAVGGTPTVTYKLQGIMKSDPTGATATDWFDLIMIPSDSDTAAITRAVTAVGRYASYISQAQSRFAKHVRLVTSLNTNVTYSANLLQQDDS
jgi:hypothetical protein